MLPLVRHMLPLVRHLCCALMLLECSHMSSDTGRVAALPHMYLEQVIVEPNFQADTACHRTQQILVRNIQSSEPNVHS